MRCLSVLKISIASTRYVATRALASFTNCGLRVEKMAQARVVRVGPSEALGMSIGDIVKEAKTPLQQGPIAARTPLLRLDWEGYGQTEGDELYHTVWNNIEGSFDLRLPFACERVVRFNDDALGDLESLLFDDDENMDAGWLVEVELASEDDLLPHLVPRDQVSKGLEALGFNEEGPTGAESRISFLK